MALAGVAFAGFSSTLDHHEKNEVADWDDNVLLHIRYFDLAGNLLLSTDPDDIAELEETAEAWTDSEFLIPGDGDLEPSHHVLSHRVEPIPLYGAAAVADLHDFVGKSVGYQVAAPVMGQMTYIEPRVVDRLRGPFNVTLETDPLTLEELADGNGQQVLLAGMIPATILSEEAERVFLRLDVEDGDLLYVKDAGFEAKVLREPGADQFHLMISAQEGHVFTATEGCDVGGYLLSRGSYRVVSVNETSILLEGTPMAWPQLIGRDLVMTLEIADIAETREALDLNHSHE